jgi:hypothetical protein
MFQFFSDGIRSLREELWPCPPPCTVCDDGHSIIIAVLLLNASDAADDDDKQYQVCISNLKSFTGNATKSSQRVHVTRYLTSCLRQ